MPGFPHHSRPGSPLHQDCFWLNEPPSSFHQSMSHHLPFHTTSQLHENTLCFYFNLFQVCHKNIQMCDEIELGRQPYKLLNDYFDKGHLGKIFIVSLSSIFKMKFWDLIFPPFLSFFSFASGSVMRIFSCGKAFSFCSFIIFCYFLPHGRYNWEVTFRNHWKFWPRLSVGTGI